MTTVVNPIEDEINHGDSHHGGRFLMEFEKNIKNLSFLCPVMY